MGRCGERAGPVARYFLRALRRAGVEVWYGARVERVLRVGGAVRAVEFVRGGVRRWWVWRRGGRLCSLAARSGRRRYCGRAGLGRGISWRLCALLGGADGGREAVDRPASCVRPPATRRSLSTQSSSLCRLPIPGGRRRLQLLGSLQDPVPADAER